MYHVRTVNFHSCTGGYEFLKAEILSVLGLPISRFRRRQPALAVTAKTKGAWVKGDSQTKHHTAAYIYVILSRLSGQIIHHTFSYDITLSGLVSWYQSCVLNNDIKAALGENHGQCGQVP